MNNYFENHHLDGNEFELIQNNPACVLLTHGFTATTVEVKPFADQLFKAGFDVSAPLLPGHNTDPFDLNKKQYTDWTDYMENKLKAVCSRYETVFVAGESMGGLLSCYLAERYPKITGLLLFAPAISVKNLALLGILRYFKPYIGQPDESEAVDEDERGYIYPWKGYNVKPTTAGFELYRLQRLVRKDLAKINQPALIFQGVHDQTIEVKSAEIVYQEISSLQKELIYLQDSAHCIILDKEFDFVVEKSLQFLAKLSNHGLG
jgi:carboxylesterase